MIDAWNFVDSRYLWTALGLIPLLLFLLFFEKVRIKRLALINASYNAKTSKIRLILPLIIIACLILGICRPYLGFESIKVQSFSRDILILQDISRSMLAKDINPSRLDFAKRKIDDLLRLISQSRSKDRIGLILFSGESYLYCPLTEDYGVVNYFARTITPDLISSQGTSISDALATAVKSLADVKSKEPFVLFITDGEDLSLEIDSALKLARDNSLKLNVLGIGSEEGSPIPDNRGGFIKDSNGQTVISRLNTNEVKRLSEESGGQFIKATLNDSDLETLLEYNQQSATSGQKFERNVNVYNEKGYLFALVPLMLFILLIIARKESLIFGLFFLIALNANTSEAQTPIPDNDTSILSLHEAYNAYNNSDYENALKTFQTEYIKNPQDLKTAQALGNTLYKLGKHKEALELFNKVSSETKDGKQKFEAEYNAGNSEFKLERYKDSIQRFKNALNLKPQDSDTLHNLKQAELALLNVKPTPTPTPTPTPSSDQNKDSKDDKNQEQKDEKEKQEQDKQLEENQNQEQSEDKEKEQESEKDKQNEQEKESEDKQKEEQEKEQDAEQKNSQEKQNEKEQQNAEPAKPMDEKALKESEAKAWLESLPDAPLLLRRKTTRNQQRRQQTW